MGQRRTMDGTVGHRRHRGDIMSPENRSALMARIKGKDTGPEKALSFALLERGLSWDSHAKDLPGCPDFVFRQVRLAVFVDGDFWHGFRFHLWRDKLSEAWEAKIALTRRRDRRNSRLLRSAGWTVVRIWEHEIERSTQRAAKKVVLALGASSAPELRPGQEGPNLVATTNGIADC